VSAGGDTLLISLVPSGSTVTVVSNDHEAATTGTIEMYSNEFRELELLGYAADGRYVIAAPLVSATVDDARLVTIALDAVHTGIVMTSHATGATTLRLNVDDIAVQYQIKLTPTP
jgi:hypothetical protein